MSIKRMRVWAPLYLFMGTLVSDTFAPFASAEQKRSVLFLAVDDMNDWVNCLGGYEGTVYTPNIDRLAKRGMPACKEHDRHSPV